MSHFIKKAVSSTPLFIFLNSFSAYKAAAYLRATSSQLITLKNAFT